MKPTVPEVLPALEAYYRLPGNGNGGRLHVVTEDANVEQGLMESIVANCQETGDAVGLAIAKVLARMSRTQRLKLYHADKPREGGGTLDQFWEAMKGIAPETQANEENPC